MFAVSCKFLNVDLALLKFLYTLINVFLVSLLNEIFDLGEYILEIIASFIPLKIV
jgi:hypothetical protein